VSDKRTFRGAVQRSTSGSMSPKELARFFSDGYGSGDVRNPYQAVSIVYACVRRLADVMASLPMRISTADDQIVEDGPLAALAARPSKGLTARSFKREMRAYLSLFGKAYIVKVIAGNSLLGYSSRSPIEIEEDWDWSTGELRGYWFTPYNAAGARTYLMPEEVHRIVDPNFGDGHTMNGLSPCQAAGLAIRQHYKADVANDQSLENGASGGIGLRTDQTLTEPQRKELKSQMQRQHSGHKKRHQWLLLEGGLSVERMFQSFAEMEFTELKRMSRDDICASFGLSSISLGFPPNQGQADDRDNIEMHEWTNTHLPFAEWFAEEWSEAIIPHFKNDRSLSMRDCRRRSMTIGEHRNPVRRELRANALATGRQYFAWFDTSSEPVLRRAALQEVQSQKLLAEMGVPINQILRATDAPYEEVPWGDTWWKPAMLVDVTAESLPIDDEPYISPEEPGDAEPEPNPEQDDQEIASAGFELRDVTEQQLDAIWNAWRMSWAGLEKSLRNRVRRLFLELRSETLRRLDSVLGGQKSLGETTQKDVIGEIVFDLVSANKRLLAVARPLLRSSFELGGQQAMREHADGQGRSEPDEFNIESPEVVESLRRREIQLTNVNRTLRKQVANAIADGLAKQESVAEISERVRTKFNQGTNRANTIAQTEVGRAVEEARQHGRSQAGTPLKSWLWSRKTDGRSWHFQTEQQTLAAPIPNEADFVVASTGNRCLHPRATGDPKDDINCGCTTISRFPNDDIKSVVAGYLQRGFVDCDHLLKRLRSQEPTHA